MGEAKRRKAVNRQVTELLRQRIAAGEFGPPARAAGYLIVLDKSPDGLAMADALRSFDRLEGLAELLDGAAWRLWQSSSLFGYALLGGGAGTPDQRTLLASDLRRLCDEVLPRAQRRLQRVDGPQGLVLAVSDEARVAIEASIAERSG